MYELGKGRITERRRDRERVREREGREKRGRRGGADDDGNVS
jgi:hypothetical protein